MPWFRVDDGFHSHPKALATSLAARGLWVTAGSWSSAHLTDGVVPDNVLASLGGSPELAAELVAAGLWKRRRNGWQFHEWSDKNPTKEAVEKERKAAADRQRRRRNGVSSRRDTAVSNGVSHTTPSRRDGSTERHTPVPSGVNGRAGPPGSPVHARPPWCGECDEATRMLDPDRPRRCPNCHPLQAVEAS